ncbi:MAG: serine/threonine-protein kinase [Planctomycetaceae bacterium]
MAAPRTAVEFCDVLRSSGLLTNAQLEEISALAAELALPAALARKLVELEWLTGWQAEHLLAGRSGFRIDAYDLLQQLGRGRMGVVYQARKRSTGRIVAIKIMAPDHVKNPRSVARFLREIRLIASVHHPNVVAAFDAGQLSDKRYFLVTEYVPGRNLADWLKEESPLPVRWVCQSVLQAARGLEHTHAQGLLHRDIKPSNIVAVGDSVDKLPQVKLLDLGLGRFAEAEFENGDITRDGYSVGTIEYSAPEQIQNARTVDIRADVYSLGMTAFQLLTGELPFMRETPIASLTAKFVEEPPCAAKLRSDVPTPLARVISAMMEREPERRPVPNEVVRSLLPFAQF